MRRGAFWGSTGVAGLSLTVLVLASTAASGCAAGGGRTYERWVSVEEMQQAFDQGKQLGEAIANVINAYRRH